MSHSKYRKRGFSWCIECSVPYIKKYIRYCAICGHKGYSPVIEADDFYDKNKEYSMNKMIYQELTKTLSKLELDRLGRCEYCAKAQGDDFQAA
ncbi:MAG: hypothetical protein IJ187_02470 [Neisseriaceae bacterium]|nr:hypothetical protein [Neisseriaceae bacterium]